MERLKKFQPAWIPGVLFRPRSTFAQITAQPVTTWLAPLLILTVTGFLVILVSGSLQGKSAGEITLPPDYQYMTPEQQAQYNQANQLRQGPVFKFVFPAFSMLLKVWVGWLLVGGIIHLVLTFLGGRGSAANALTLVAWAGLPFAIRDLVRLAYILFTQKLIVSSGVSGLLDASQGGLILFLANLLALIDIYLVWHVLILIAGIRSTSGLKTSKAVVSISFTILGVLVLQALSSYALASLANLSIVRMFF